MASTPATLTINHNPIFDESLTSPLSFVKIPTVEEEIQKLYVTIVEAEFMI